MALDGPLLLDLIPRAYVTLRPLVVEDNSLPAGQEKVRMRKVAFHNFMISNWWHRIDVQDEFIVRKKVDQNKSDRGSDGVIKSWTEKTSKKVYTFHDMGIDQPGEPWWLSYRHQLEQLVNRIRGRPGTGLWLDGEDSIGRMKMLDMVYEKSPLPVRPTSRFRLDETTHSV